MGKLDYGLIFLLGFFSCAFIFLLYFGFGEMVGLVVADDLDLSAPSDWIADEDVLVLDDRVIIFVDNATLSGYEPTGSMRPVLGAGAGGLRVVPESEGQVKVGDIISFRADEKLIVHRIVEKGLDGEGVYFVTKGDNNSVVDGKIRFEEIEYVTVGVFW